MVIAPPAVTEDDDTETFEVLAIVSRVKLPLTAAAVPHDCVYRNEAE